MNTRFVFSSLLALCGLFPAFAESTVKVEHFSVNNSLVRVEGDGKYLLLPVSEASSEASVNVLVDGNLERTIYVRLATSAVDYMVPFDLTPYKGHKLALNVVTNNGLHSESDRCWSDLQVVDEFDTTNREKFRPLFHHTPKYGWMNDPNGMFYKDGVWHLYFQYNPYGSQWENMTWGHSTSTDLVNWKFEGEAIEPDVIGTIFSGSAVVDKKNTAGFGEGAVVALYTSAGENQTQSMAYSTDNGKTFTKYEGNPIITSNVPDFRDPHMFWNEDIKKWNMILAAGQQMNIYSSDNLKDWTYESSFGAEYGNHGGVWECPDLMKLKVRGTDKEKWMLLCNINPGGPFGGSATQYFIGEFDGHKFTCESKPEVTKWMDYGKDHYATVTFDNAPDGRRVAMAWMSNWQYANQVPTQQYRSANSIARDLGLFEYKGETYCSVTPSPEMTAARSKKTSKALSEACEAVVNVKGNATVTLSNDKGEKVVMTYNAKAETFEMDRTKSGKTDFSNEFAAVTKAPTYGKISQFRIFIDKSSVEVLDAEGKMAMTNLVFPTKPYNKLTLKGKGKYMVYQIGK